jgi:hypothetical protein
MSFSTTRNLALKIAPPGNIVFYQLANAAPRLLESVKRDPNWMLDPKIQNELGHFSHWSCTLQWLYNLKWDGDHKIDFYKPMRDFCKPHGVLLKATLDVCEYCYDHDSKHEFENHLFWFRGLALELEHLMFGLPETGGKAARVKEFRDFATQLKENKNPFCFNEYPNLYSLGGSICHLQIDPLHKDFYSKFLSRDNKKTNQFGFLTAVQRFANFLHSDQRCLVTKADDTGILQKQGSGKGFQKTDRETIKTWVRPDCIPGEGFKG